ncbi:uncharacterized protein LOC109725491 isoform X2 [Ananas comosus]|uniref:Uncharacterized protein LOC109725491 isoform X2 n=1 Tax=Ananas comosus TaxID=4615 RepID=A0A6P5GXA0_ANACO|nr:uncharacterized protein LOC109725491 isoform X2 [Ananas comosus]
MAKEGREIASSAAAAVVPLLRPPPQRKGSYARCLSHAGDELKSFRTCLRWMCVDHSDTLRSAVSWSMFFFLSAAVPAADHLLLIPASSPRRRYDAVVQLSLSAAAALAYLSLSGFVRRHGLRRLLLLDRLRRDSDRVRRGYAGQLGRSFRLLAAFVLPCCAAEAAYKAFWWWRWRSAAGGRWPAIGAAAAACVLELASWAYRTAIFFLACVLFRLICHLQILRMHDFAAAFQAETDVAAVLRQHIRIRQQLSVISHRYRGFIVSALLLVTVSQFATLLLTTRPHAQVNIYTAGELALCSLGLVMGMLMCLRSAAKITHKTQAITSHAAAWHACATIDPSDAADDPETHARTNCEEGDGSDSDDEDDEEEEEEERDEDDLDDAKLMPTSYAIASTVSFQKRQALATEMLSVCETGKCRALQQKSRTVA